MSARDLGKHAGMIAIGTVVNHLDDPSQSGRVRVRWTTGSVTQDQIADDDLPWISSMFSTSDPAQAQTGGPHTGLRKGSMVMGMPLDDLGQDFVILGSLLKGGAGGPDQPAQFDSDIPQTAKSPQNGGEEQRRYGDVNGIVSKDSIVKFAEEAGGVAKSVARFAQIADSIGTLGRII